MGKPERNDPPNRQPDRRSGRGERLKIESDPMRVIDRLLGRQPAQDEGEVTREQVQHEREQSDGEGRQQEK